MSAHQQYMEFHSAVKGLAEACAGVRGPSCLSLTKAAAAMGISRRRLDSFIRIGMVLTVRAHGRRMVSRSEVSGFLEQ